MANITFTLGGDTFTFSKGREYPVKNPARVNVVTEQSEGGKVYAYDKGVGEQTHVLTFRGLDQTDYDNLDDWLRNIAVGPKNTFTYTDEDSNDHTVRLMDTENPLQEDLYGLYSGTITLREEV